MIHRKCILIIFIAALLFQGGSVCAQAILTTMEMSISIDSINKILQKNYIFPDVADKMARSLVENLRKGKYHSLTNPSGFASQITKDLQSISKDKHLRIVYDPKVIAAERQAIKSNNREALEAEFAADVKRNNYGFKEMNILEGNIGYLDLREFIDTKYAGETAIAAMNFLSNSDAIIIDLRNNGGGSPSMIQLISSYFFTDEPVHLNTFYFRPTNETTETWTLSNIKGKRRPDVPLFLLTSNRTFSAAEEFCYNLKNLKRATVIGETTGGGAHPTGSEIATNNFYVRVPKGRAINPITKTNWEGTGVTPDIPVSADEALKIALVKARESRGR